MTNQTSQPAQIDIKWCPQVCERAVWHQDPQFPHLGQHNCPYYFGVDHFAAIQDGVVHCKHLKRKVVDA